MTSVAPDSKTFATSSTAMFAPISISKHTELPLSYDCRSFRERIRCVETEGWERKIGSGGPFLSPQLNVALVHKRSSLSSSSSIHRHLTFIILCPFFSRHRLRQPSHPFYEPSTRRFTPPIPHYIASSPLRQPIACNNHQTPTHSHLQQST